MLDHSYAHLWAVSVALRGFLTAGDRAEKFLIVEAKSYHHRTCSMG